MIDRTVIIELPVKEDGTTEGAETAVFTLAAGAAYDISPTANKVRVIPMLIGQKMSISTK